MDYICLDSFTPAELEVIHRLDLSRLPTHIAVIMDGNGRWATQQGLPRVIGHRAGVESIRSVVTACQDLGIRYITLYSFSTENWRRPPEEVRALMELIEIQLRDELDSLHARGVRVRHIGRLDGLPESLQTVLTDSIARTQHNPGLTVVFAVNYSGRAELVDAARRLAAEAVAGTLDPHVLDEEDINRALYAPDIPNPDILIRSGGDMRVSNYLLWQIAYTELYITPVLWPELHALHLLQAIEEYQHRQRKFGRVTP
ncbi:MAG: polyprenyl diphosphate synthase [Armatimonadota bacterium]